MIYWIALVSLIFLAVPAAYAQVNVTVNQTTPCFLNYSAGADMWRQCGATTDYIQFALLPFEWVSGGYFSMILASVIIGMVWIIYQKTIYPLLIGFVFLFMSWFVFPSQFLIWGIIMGVLSIGIMIYYAVAKATKEY